MSTSLTDPYAKLAQAHSDMLADTWASNDPQLAERFSEAMKKAWAEYPDDISAAMRKAWESDPELRVQYGKAMSEGLRKMWADPERHAQMGEALSERSRKMWAEADPEVRKQWGEAVSAGVRKIWAGPAARALRKGRSEALKRHWADAGFREKMLAAADQRRGNPQWGALMSAQAKKAGLILRRKRNGLQK